MPSLIDFAGMDLRSAFDLAIMIEEDAQLRYEQLARLLGDDPGGAGDIFRMMAVNEAKHRDQLLTRRDALFCEAPTRIQISVMEVGVERPEVDEDALPATAREALEVALAAEGRAYDFYRDALPHIADPAVLPFFRDLMQEEAEHHELLSRKISRLGAGASPCEGRATPLAAAPPAPAEPFPDRAAVEAILPRFDAATQAVAVGVLLRGMDAEEVAAALGVSRRTVASKLRQFLGMARQYAAVMVAAAAMSGCAGGAYDSSTGQFISGATPGSQGTASARGASASGSCGPARPAAAEGPSYGQPRAAYDPGPAPATSRGLPAGDGSGSFDPSSRTPPAPTLQADGTQLKPALANVSPPSGSVEGGSEVLITGSGFANAQVLIGSSIARVTSQSSNAITVIAPEGNAGPVAVVVTNRDGAYAVSGAAYTYR